MPTWRDWSLSSLNGNWNFSANFLFSAGESNEMPRISTPFFA
jgi:hypothetical protein